MIHPTKKVESGPSVTNSEFTIDYNIFNIASVTQNTSALHSCRDLWENVKLQKQMPTRSLELLQYVFIGSFISYAKQEEKDFLTCKYPSLAHKKRSCHKQVNLQVHHLAWARYGFSLILIIHSVNTTCANFFLLCITAHFSKSFCDFPLLLFWHVPRQNCSDEMLRDVRLERG